LGAQCISDILEDLDYDMGEILENLNFKIESSGLKDINSKQYILEEIKSLLNDNCYLKNEEYR
jgi:arginine decarboxylase